MPQAQEAKIVKKEEVPCERCKKALGTGDCPRCKEIRLEELKGVYSVA